MSDEGVCRTAPATPGLLKTIYRFFWSLKKVFRHISKARLDWKTAFRGFHASYDSLIVSMLGKTLWDYLL